MILIVDDHIGRHLALAVKEHVRELRRSGLPVPAVLLDLVTVCATGGQARPTLDGPTGTGEGAAMDELTVDYRSAAGRLGVSDRSVRRLVRAGQLPAVEVGGAKRIRVADLREYVDRLQPVDPEATE